MASRHEMVSTAYSNILADKSLLSIGDQMNYEWQVDYETMKEVASNLKVAFDAMKQQGITPGYHLRLAIEILRKRIEQYGDTVSEI